ncbi:hypothetical protein [uncultured Dialister sp.]|uniref:hypothetical protein n=1 Tax=uncultured Dialister sp. TaxID=278064 RepID=UPI0025D7B40E|nr:hypothetical protein [uncultured Dialister sp.]
MDYAAKRGIKIKPKIKKEGWVERESISILNKRLQIDRELTKAYNEQRAVDGLGDTSKYEAVNITSEETGDMDKVSQTAMKVYRDVETVRKNRISDFHSRRDTFSQKWKQMEDIMRQEGVESIEIPHKD